jgi:hypothetical protein
MEEDIETVEEHTQGKDEEESKVNEFIFEGFLYKSKSKGKESLVNVKLIKDWDYRYNIINIYGDSSAY